MKTSRLNAVTIALWAVVLILASITITGCSSTVTPDVVATASVPSYDGNEQNSGVIALEAHGWVVTAHFRDRYNALVQTYGERFSPALRKDDGVGPGSHGRWIIDRQHFDAFLKMNTWRRSAIQAPRTN